MKRSFSILIAEPSLLLREKIACVLARDDRVWCVTQVEGRSGLIRGVADIHPDFILADLSILNDIETVAFIRQSSNSSQIFALVDSCRDPYMKVANRLGLDGIIEKGRVAEGMKDTISKAATSPEDSDDDSD